MLRAILLLSLCVPTWAQSPVIVVDDDLPPPPGVDFGQISDAIAAATGGVTIFVHGGSYSPFTVHGLSLTIVADPSDPVFIDGGVVIEAVASDQTVMLRGLSSGEVSIKPGLHISGSAGHVWIEACDFHGGNHGDEAPGIQVDDCLAVSLVRCTATGGTGTNSGQFTGPHGTEALRVSNSIVAAWEVVATGGYGYGSEENGGWGGQGALVTQGGRLLASGGAFTGGAGGACGEDFDFICGCWTCHIEGSGGEGLRVHFDSYATLRDVELAGGAGGYDPTVSSCGPGSPGFPLQDDALHVDLLPGAARSLSLSSPASEGEPMQVELLGQPGDAALVLVSLSPTFAILPAGVLSVSPSLITVIGSLPPSGNLSLGVTLPLLAPAVDSLLLRAQPLFVPAGGGKVLGAPSATVLLDSQF